MKRKAPYLISGLLLLPLLALCLFLQAIPAGVQEAHQVYIPEKWDRYGQNGLAPGTNLSQKKILETDTTVAYADRIFQLLSISDQQAGYALQAAQAMQNACPGVKNVYLLPIPGRAVLEPDYPEQTEQFESFVESLQETGDVINVLPQLEANGGRNLFFRTEISWTMEGAFYGYQAILEKLGMEPDDLLGYRKYLFGDFHGSVLTAQKAQCKSEKLLEQLQGIPDDPYVLYINGGNPNREKVTQEYDPEDTVQTVARRTVRMSSMGPNGIVGNNDFLHSMVNGRGQGGIVLVTDQAGKLLAPYLSEAYEWVYVVNVLEDEGFRQDLPEILEEIGADTVIYAATENRLGNKSYMRAMNPFVRGEG